MPARARGLTTFAARRETRRMSHAAPRPDVHPDARFQLHAFWRTSATYRVRVALALKGLAADEVNVDIDKGEQHGEAFRRLNPLGGLPALRDRRGERPDAVLTQSLAILEYLEEVCPRPALLPEGALARARVRSIALMCAADTHPLIVPRVRKYLTEAGFDADAWRAWQTQWFTTGLRGVEARLRADPETGTYCHGESVTIADICLASIVAVMRVFGIEVSGIPIVDGIIAACEAQEAFARAEPRRQFGAPATAPG